MRRCRMWGSSWRAGRLAALPVGVLTFAAAHAAPPVVQQPRSYGHVLGDVLTQRVELVDAAGQPEVPVPPPVARVNGWFDRLPARIETDAQGRAWLRIDYQVINTHRDLELASLPALTLEMKSGHSVSIPEWPVSIGPLTPDTVFGQGGLQSMQPDHGPAPRATARVEQRLRVWALLLGLTLLAWLGWYVSRNARDARALPFARAARALRRLGRGGAPEGSDAWIALHRAFNEAAGRAVHAESLPPLFERAPYLEPLRAEIEGFYAASSQRFFARTPADAPMRLDELCRRLHLAEKRGSSGGA